MTTVPPVGMAEEVIEQENLDAVEATTGKRRRRRRIDPTRTAASPLATVVAILIATVWTVPTLGLLITSFRPQIDITRSGWWTIFTNPSFTLSNYQQALSGSGSSSPSKWPLPLRSRNTCASTDDVPVPERESARQRRSTRCSEVKIFTPIS